MISCPRCSHVHHSGFAACDNCAFEPPIVDGFKAWAPELAHGGAGGEFFNPEDFQKLAALEEGNFWFRNRGRLVTWALSRYCERVTSYAEVGCGTGYMLTIVADRFPDAAVLGSELFTAGLAHAAERAPRATLIQMDARFVPYREEFDTVGIYDVLEHIDDDSAVLAAIHRALKSGGMLVVTVPQHRWLWSKADEIACHVRRYTKRELHEKLEHAGFEIVRSTSFVSLLLPLFAASRMWNKGEESNPYAEFELPRWLNWVLEKALAIESLAIRSGVDFGAGGSRLVLAKKIQLDDPNDSVQ